MAAIHDLPVEVGIEAVERAAGLALAVVHGGGPDAAGGVGHGTVEAVVRIVGLRLPAGLRHHGAGGEEDKAALLQAGDEALAVGPLAEPAARLRHLHGGEVDGAGTGAV